MKQKIQFMDIVNYIVCGLFALVCLYPLYYVMINTISDNSLSEMGKIILSPKGIHFTNYTQVMKLQGLPLAAMVSIARTALGTLVSVLGASFLGYALSKQNFWHRKFWYRFNIATMYFSAGLIPGYLTMYYLHLVDTFWIYILPGLSAPFNMILVKTYLESLPASMEESAEIDGAKILTRFSRIVLPLAIPILATIAVFSAVGQWNSFMDTVIYISDSRLHTLQFVLNRYLNQSAALARMLASMNLSNASSLANQQSAITPIGVRYTVTVVTVVPVLLVYPFSQRYFIKGIMIGAVKG